VLNPEHEVFCSHFQKRARGVDFREAWGFQGGESIFWRSEPRIGKSRETVILGIPESG
jgi:hypothetical protein